MERVFGRLGFRLNCKTCNTRLPRGKRVCPNCGHTGTTVAARGEGSAAPKKRTSSGSEPLSPSNLSAFGEREKHEGGKSPLFSGNEKAFDQELEIALSRATQARVRSPRKATGRKAPGSKAPGGKQASTPAATYSDTRPRPAGNVVLPVEAEQVRHLVIERPEVLEVGLAVHLDDEGIAVGAGLPTDVGEIDLLARSGAGDWVVVMVVPDACDQETAIAGMIQRLGWVRKHLSERQERVRGIVLAGWTSSELVYAAAALNDSVSFLGWRLSLEFEPLVS